MGVIIDDILERPFFNRSDDERLKIILDGKPRPVLLDMKLPSAKNEGKFDDSIYDKEPWITACEKRQAYFCWPCLLFTQEQQSWNTTGFNDLRHLVDAIMKHKKTVSHVQGMLSLQLLLHKYLIPVDNEPAVKRHNEIVLRNRDLVKRIITVICTAASLQSPPNKGTSDYNKFKLEDCIEGLRMLRNYDANNVTDDAINLIQRSPKVLVDLVMVISNTVKSIIKKESQSSTYVSVILNEHSDIDMKSQLSTVLRYVKNGKVCERFIGFTNINEYKTAAVIQKHISTIITGYEIDERFLAHSYDGAVLASSHHLKSLKKKLRDDYPLAFFTHCYCNELEFILEQSLSRIKECELFFKKINSIKAFFRRNPDAVTAVNEYLHETIFEHGNNSLRTSTFLKAVKMHRKELLNFFKSVIENFEEWTPSEIADAYGFQEILNDFETIFQLFIFYNVFERTSSLSSILTGDYPENAFGSSEVEVLKQSLGTFRDNGFKDMWILLIAEILGTDEEQKPKSVKTALEPDTKLMYQEFYFKVIDFVILEIDIRFSDLKELMFFNILNYDKHKKYVITNEPLQSLLAAYGPYFDETWLKNELKVLCTNGAVFNRKTVFGLMDLFMSAKLNDTFKYLFKLTEMILTMPCKRPPGTSSKLEQINVWSNISENQDSAATDWNFLCVEKDYIEEIRNTPEFYDEVMTKFQEIPGVHNSMELSICE